MSTTSFAFEVDSNRKGGRALAVDRFDGFVQAFEQTDG
jgi:hypothetical protein